MTSNKQNDAIKLYLFERTGKVLFVKSPRHWTLPGGKIEGSESEVDTLVRELMEEVPFLSWTFLGIVHYQKSNDFRCAVFIGYVHKVEPTVTVANEITEYVWARPSYFREIDKSHYWKDFIEVYKDLKKTVLLLKLMNPGSITAITETLRGLL